MNTAEIPFETTSEARIEHSPERPIEEQKTTTFIDTLFAKLQNDKSSLKILALILFQIAFFSLYHALNKGYETWDSAGHIGMSMQMADELKKLFTAQTSVKEFLTVSDYYPPLIPIIGGVLNLIFGYNSQILLTLGLAFFIVSIIYVYKLALHLSQNKDMALVTATLYSLFPHVYEQARMFHLDIPLIAFLVIATYHLLKSEGFQNFKHTLIFFLFFAFAQLTKWYGVIYLAIPIGYGVFKFFASGLNFKKFRNILVGSVIFSLTAFPWYVLNFTELLGFTKIFSQGEIDDPQSFWTLENFMYYPFRIFTNQIFLLPTVLMLVGGFLYTKEKGKRGVLVLVSVLIPLGTFICVGNKNLRYILPLTVIFAFYISYFVIVKLRGTWLLRITLVYLILSAGFVSFNQSQAEAGYLKPISMALAGPGYKDWYYNPGFYRYEPNEWPIEEVLLFIYEDAGSPDYDALGVVPLIDRKNFSLATLDMIRRENKLLNIYLPVPYLKFDVFSTENLIEQYLDEYDVQYLIVPQDPGPIGLRNYKVLKQMIDYLVSDKNTNYTVVKRFQLPDGSSVLIYKRDEKGNFIGSSECIDYAGFADGVESIRLIPNHTFIFYTGHFGIDDYKWEYESGTLYIVKIENDVHESILNVHSLTSNGASLCSREGLELDLGVEVARPLQEPGHCGVDCQKVVEVTWRVGEGLVSEIVYTR